MLLDLILDRKRREEPGYEYDPGEFYNNLWDIFDRGELYAMEILRAMYIGDNELTRGVICWYIDFIKYDPKLKGWVNSREWV